MNSIAHSGVSILQELENYFEQINEISCVLRLRFSRVKGVGESSISVGAAGSQPLSTYSRELGAQSRVLNLILRILAQSKERYRYAR